MHKMSLFRGFSNIRLGEGQFHSEYPQISSAMIKDYHPANLKLLHSDTFKGTCKENFS